MRLCTLAQIRWVAVVGQAVALLLVHYGLGVTLPIVPVLGVVAASALVNLVTSMGRPGVRRVRWRLLWAAQRFSILSRGRKGAGCRMWGPEHRSPVCKQSSTIP